MTKALFPETGPVTGDLLALLAGSVCTLSFAPWSFWPISILSLALLFLLWQPVTAGRAAWRSFLFSTGLFGFGIAWLHESFGYSHVALPLAIILTGGFVIFMAGYPALLTYLMQRYSRGTSLLVRMLMVYPSGWVLLEWIRSWLFSGFPWLQAGYSQVDSPLAGIAPITGVLGITWLVMLTAGGIALMVLAPHRWQRILPMLLSVWLLAGFIGQVTWTEASGPEKTVALIQGNFSQELKWLPAMRGPTLERYRSMTRELSSVDLVIWPETAIPSYQNSVSRYLSETAHDARDGGYDLLTGIPIVEADGRYFNSILLLGSQDAVYHKVHLVPFGEYLPQRWLLDGLINFLRIPMSRFSAGDPGQPLLVAAGETVGASICYEGIFGEEIIQSLPEATILVNISNDAWFGRSIAADQQLQMARLRARETGRFLLRSTNTGISAIIGPAGQVIKRSPRFEQHALVGGFTGMQGSTPYVVAGNWPVVVLALVVLLLGLRNKLDSTNGINN